MQRATEVKELETKTPKPPVKLSSLNHAAYLYQIEHKITLRELQEINKFREALIASTGSTEANIKAVIAFFNNRWERIQKTNLCYPHAPQHKVTQECLALATECAPYIKRFIQDQCLAITKEATGAEIKDINELNDATKFKSPEAQQKAITACLMFAKQYIPTLVDVEDLIKLRVYPFSLLMPTVNFRERDDVTSVTAVTGADLNKLRLQDIILSEDNKTYIEVKMCLSKVAGDILAMADTQCDLLTMATMPTKDNLKKIVLSSPQAYQAYVRCGSKLYYINKLTGECIIFPIKAADLLLLDKELQPSAKPRTINDAELDSITKTSKHKHELMVLSHTQLLDKEDKNCRLLTEEESRRMINHSSQARHLYDAAITFVTFRNNANTSLGLALEKLVQGLKKGGMNGGNGGSSNNAGSDASIAIADFNELLELMDEEQKKYLFELTAPDDIIISAGRKTFEKIWTNLNPLKKFKQDHQRDPTLEDLKGYAEREGQCVEENAWPLEKIIEKAGRDKLLAMPIKFKAIVPVKEQDEKKASTLTTHSYYADLVKAKKIFDECYDEAKCQVTATYSVGDSAERLLAARINKQVDIQNVEELYTFLKFLGERDQHHFLQNFSEEKLKSMVKTPAQVDEVMKVFKSGDDQIIFKTIFDSDPAWMLKSITTINDLIRVIRNFGQSPLTIIKQLGEERLREIIMQQPETLQPLCELMDLLSADDCKAVIAMISSERLFELYKAFIVANQDKLTDLTRRRSSVDIENQNFIERLMSKAMESFIAFHHYTLELPSELSVLRCLIVNNIIHRDMIKLLTPAQIDEKEDKTLPVNFFNLYPKVLLEASKEHIKAIFNDYNDDEDRSYIKLCTAMIQEIQASKLPELIKSEKLAVIIASKLFKDMASEGSKPVFAVLDIQWLKPFFNGEIWKSSKGSDEFFLELQRLLRSLHKHDHDKFLALVSQMPLDLLVALLKKLNTHYIFTGTILESIPKEKRYDVLMAFSANDFDAVGEDDHNLIKEQYLSQFTLEQRIEYLNKLNHDIVAKYYLVEFKDLQQIPSEKWPSLIATEEMLDHIVSLIQPDAMAIQFLLTLDCSVFVKNIKDGKKLREFIATWRPEQQKEFQAKFKPEDYESIFVKTSADLNNYARNKECKEKEGIYRKYFSNDSWRRVNLVSDAKAFLEMEPYLFLLDVTQIDDLEYKKGSQITHCYDSTVKSEAEVIAKVIEHLVNKRAEDHILMNCLVKSGFLEKDKGWNQFVRNPLLKSMFAQLRPGTVKRLLPIALSCHKDALNDLAADFDFVITIFNGLPENDRYAFISQFSTDSLEESIRNANNISSILTKLPLNQRYEFLGKFRGTFLARLGIEHVNKYIHCLDAKDQLSFWKKMNCPYKYKINDLPELLMQFNNAADRLSVLKSFGLCIDGASYMCHHDDMVNIAQDRFFTTPEARAYPLAEQCRLFLREISASLQYYPLRNRELLAEASIRSLQVMIFPTDQDNLKAYEKVLKKLPGRSRPILAAGTALIGLASIVTAITFAPTLLCIGGAAIAFMLSVYAARKLYVNSGLAHTAASFFQNAKNQARINEEKSVLNIAIPPLPQLDFKLNVDYTIPPIDINSTIKTCF